MSESVRSFRIQDGVFLHRSFEVPARSMPTTQPGDYNPGFREGRTQRGMQLLLEQHNRMKYRLEVLNAVYKRFQYRFQISYGSILNIICSYGSILNACII